MLLLLLAAQAAAAPPERFSILVPVAPQKCPPRAIGQEPDGDVVVCATDLPDQTIPYPKEYVYAGPRPSNPDVTGTGALAAETSAPCATVQGGCTVGFGQPVIAAAVNGLIDIARDVTARKPDKRGRVPIDIGEPVAAER